MGTGPRAPALPVPRMPPHLQCVDENAPCRSSPQGPLDVFPGEIQRGGIAPEGGLAVRDQYESRLFVETPVFGLAGLFESPAGKRDCRNRREMVLEILQGATRRTPETGPKTGRAGRKTGALPGTGSRPGGPGPVGSDFRCDSSEGQPSGDQSGAGTPPGPGCRPLLGRGRKRPHRPGGSGDGRGPSGRESQQGDQGPGRRLPHPECERLPLAVERYG